MISLAITLHRDQLITDNDRLHRYKRAEMTRTLRQLGKMATLGNRGSLPTITDWPVTVRVTYQFPPGRHPTDANNLAASTKALVDGVTDSKLVFPDDSTRYVEGQDSRIHPEPWQDQRRLVRAVISIRPACQHCAA